MNAGDVLKFNTPFGPRMATIAAVHGDEITLKNGLVVKLAANSAAAAMR